MRWQRPVRWGIAIAGIGFAGLLVARYERRAPKLNTPLPPQMEKGATFQSVMSPGGKLTRYKGEKEVGAYSYARMVELSDGRREMEKPRFEGDRDGTPYVITALKGELRAPGPGAGSGPGDPSVVEEIHLIGEVVMREQDGMEIKTDDATYRESVALLEIPGAMTFTDRRTSGSGVGATYDRNAELLTLKDQAAVAIAADETGQGKLDAHARTIVLNRSLHSTTLDGDASITRDREVISASGVLMHLTDDNQGVQMMELHQHASIVPIAGAGKTPEMRSDDMTLEFQPDGRTIHRAQLFRSASLFLPGDTGRKQITGDMIDTQLAGDGQTVTSLTGTGGVVVTLPPSGDLPQRTIKARQLNATGDEKVGLNTAVFQPGVEFTETKPAARGQAATRRTVNAKQLTLALDAGDLSNIKDAHFETGVRFTSGDTTGDADDVRYLAGSGTLVMSPVGPRGARSRVVNGRITVNAKNIKIDLDKTVIDASGDLVTLTKPDPADAAKGLFDASKQMTGQAKELHYEDAKGLAVYTGNASLKQEGGSSIKGGTSVTVNSKLGDLSADGGVEAVFPIDNVEGTSKVAPKAIATTFTYKDATHTAIYQGTEKEVARLDSPDFIIRGVTIELVLADDGRELKHMVVDSPNAKALTRVRVSADRTAIGDRLVNDVTAGTYELVGSAAKVIQRSVDGAVETCDETIGPKMTFTKTENGKNTGAFTVSEAVGLSSKQQRAKTCADWTIK